MTTDPEHDHGKSATAYFDEAAQTWDDDPAKLARSHALAEHIAAAVPLQPDWSLLEYGSGTGAVGRSLAGRVGSVVLADASAGMTQVASEIIERDRLDGMRAMRLDLVGDPVPDERFDVLVSVMALHHVSDIPRVLAGFAELLRPGGWLAICDLDTDDGGHFHDADFGGHNGFDRAELAARLTAAGFAEPEFSTPYVMSKETDIGERDFPLFLAAARRR